MNEANESLMGKSIFCHKTNNQFSIRVCVPIFFFFRVRFVRFFFYYYSHHHISEMWNAMNMAQCGCSNSNMCHTHWDSHSIKQLLSWLSFVKCTNQIGVFRSDQPFSITYHSELAFTKLLSVSLSFHLLPIRSTRCVAYIIRTNNGGKVLTFESEAHFVSFHFISETYQLCTYLSRHGSSSDRPFYLYHFNECSHTSSYFKIFTKRRDRNVWDLNAWAVRHPVVVVRSTLIAICGGNNQVIAKPGLHLQTEPNQFKL